MFGVIDRMSRRQVGIAVVVDSDRLVPRAESVLGVITRNQIADSVADSLALRSRPGKPRAHASAQNRS